MTTQTLAPRAARIRSAPRVVLLGPRVGQGLPDAWQAVRLSATADIRDGDVVILDSPDVPLVAELLSTRRRVSVLALLPRDAGSQLVVELLDAGAEVCLRGAGALELHAHLVAVHRRRAG